MAIKDRGKTYIFTFSSDELGELEFKFNPDGWSETEYGLQKNDSDGIIFVFSGDYTYLKDAYDYIDQGYNEYGILWNVTLKFEQIGNHSFERETLFDNRKLDFTSVIQSAEKGNVYKIPLTDSGFYEKIKAREKDLIPYGRLVTLDGNTITPFTNDFETVTVYGQEITSIGNGSGDNEPDYVPIGRFAFVPNIIFESNSPDIKTVEYKSIAAGGYLLSDLFFLASAQTDISIDFTINWNWTDTGSIDLILDKVKYNESTEYYDILSRTINKYSGSNDYQTIISLTDTLNENEGYVLAFYDPAKTQEDLTIKTSSDLKINITQKDPPTDLAHANIFQVHERLLEAMTGQADSFVSATLDTGGDWAHIYLSNGYLYRQFTTDEAQLSFKWNELKENCERLLGLEYRLITVGGVKKIQCETKDYFYNTDIGTTVNKIENNSFTRELDITKYYSAIDVGTPKPDYESAGVLNSYSTQANYTTILSTLDNKLDLTTTYQIDGNWHELTRRLVKDAYETTDSQYDNDVCFMETILSGTLIQRTTQDFDIINGIDEITTPINLNLTPARSVYRWGKWIRVGLQKYLGQTLTIDIGFGEVTSFFPTYIKFNKSEILTELSTVRNDEGIEVSENVDIDPNSLDEPIITGNIIKVNGDLSYQDIKTIEDDTTKKIDVPDEISGERIQGWPILATIKPVGESLTNLEIMESREVTEDDNAIQWTDQENIDWTSSESIDWV